MMKKLNKRLIILSIIIFIVVIVMIFIVRRSFALEDDNNYRNNYILNHDWVKYMELTDEEKLSYEIVPEKFIYQLKENKVSFFSLRNKYPSYYN